MTAESLKASGVETTYESAANELGVSTRISMGAYNELFPRIHGGLKASAVLEAHKVNRTDDGAFRLSTVIRRQYQSPWTPG